MIKRPLDQAQEAICPGAYLYSRVGASRLRGRSQLYPFMFIQWASWQRLLLVTLETNEGQ